MVQLILDTGEYNITLPESKHGGYTITKQPLSVDVEMITGRMVRELRGNVWTITYQYGYFSDYEKNRLIAAIEKGRREPINCGFLPPNSAEELLYSDFLVTDFTYPTFYWSREDGEEVHPIWGNFSVSLREVRPSD